jgi:hypothetical protein
MSNKLGKALLIGSWVLAVVATQQAAAAAQSSSGLVMVIELEIVASQLVPFGTSQAAFDIVFERDTPNHVLLFEVFDSAEAFAAHQATAHFKKYEAATANMVTSRKRIEMIRVALLAKGR